MMHSRQVSPDTLSKELTLLLCNLQQQKQQHQCSLLFIAQKLSNQERARQQGKLALSLGKSLAAALQQQQQQQQRK
jgi:hypothetical protein